MKKKTAIILCSVGQRVFLVLGGATCIAEGHPYLGTVLLAIAGGLMELKEQLTKKQTNTE